MDRRVAWTWAIAPFATLAAVLRQFPAEPGAVELIPTWQALTAAAVLFAAMAGHSLASSRWTPHAPNRMLVNEFLVRAAFALAGLVAVSLFGDTGPLYLVMASAWAVAAWCTHYLVLRMQGAYRVLENLAQHGLFLLGLALMGLIAVRLAVTG